MHRQHIYEYIDLFWQENGYAPSLREIGEHVGLSSSTVGRYLQILAARGAIEWQPNMPRTVRICGPLR
jgi:repressor LexA